MSILKTIVCDICKEVMVEPTPDAGWEGWGQLSGISLNGIDNPSLCPNHLAQVADFVDSLVGE